MPRDVSETILGLTKKADCALWQLIDVLDQQETKFEYYDYLESITEACEELQKRAEGE